jgi:two-component system LytT family sensor kinase
MNKFWRYRLDHISFWLLTVGFQAYTHRGLIGRAGWETWAAELLIRNGLLAIVIYGTLGWVVPRFFDRNKYTTGVLMVMLLMGTYVLTKNAHDTYLYGTLLHDTSRERFFSNTYYNLSIVVFYLAFSFALYLSKQWYAQREKLRAMEMEKLQTELAYLKAQINPHFLFNSINTIYFQIDRQNTIARDTLSRFSDLLRYQLYECNGDMIAIEQEMNYLNNYVELQRARKDEHYQIRFEVADSVRGFVIPPLLLISFVENAFKHVSHATDSINRIDIQAAYNGRDFSFVVFNTRGATSTAGEEFHGIGLKNARRRLDLLFPKRYHLDIQTAPDSFRVELQLNVHAV